MVIGKIRPTATIVAQFAAGVEVEAIQHEGKMFLPVVAMGDFETSTETPKKSEPTPVASSKKKEEDASEDSDSAYTEEELMDMSTKDLLKLCKEMGINPDDTEGKNTNKKLRNLILDAQEAGEDSDDEDSDDDEDDDKSSKSKKDSDEDDELTQQIADILEDFDSGKKNKKKTISAICELSEDADKDAVTKLVDKFEDDADADIDELASEIAKVLSDSSEEDEDEDDADEDDKKSSKKKSKNKLVDASDLKVGDRVSVWWNDDNQEWYDGEVKSISKKGVVTIAYDDDTEDTIDPEIHTKIKRIDD